MRASVAMRIGLGLLLVLSAPLISQADATARPDELLLPGSAGPAQVDTTQRDSARDVAAHAPSDGGSTFIGAAEEWADALFEGIVLLLVGSLLITIVGVFIGGFAAVSIFMDTGCLRFVVFGLGWIPACFSGFLVGILLSEWTGWEALMGAGVQAGFWGYPLGWALGLRRVKQLPRETYVTWKRTLTGGALLGAGLGSAFGMLRSSAALLKGGGGSFGGGGASGSFGASSSVSGSGGGAVGAAAGGPAVTGEAVALGGAGVAMQAAASSGSASTAATPPTAAGFWHRVWAKLRWVRRVRWYHACAFVLVVLIFVPVGLGMAAWFEDPKVVLFVGAAALLIGGYRLFRRWAVSSSRPASSGKAFQGGGAAASWS